MEKALTSEAYGEDPQDAKDTIARGTEIGKDDESKPKETTPIENRPGETFGKNYKSVGDMMNSISQQKERVQLNITDLDSMDQFNGALFIEDGKLMYPGLDGEPTEVNDQDTQMALFDLVQDEQVNVGRSEFRQGDRIKDNGGMHSANILKNLKGNLGLEVIFINNATLSLNYERFQHLDSDRSGKTETFIIKIGKIIKDKSEFAFNYEPLQNNQMELSYVKNINGFDFKVNSNYSLMKQIPDYGANLEVSAKF